VSIILTATVLDGVDPPWGALVALYFVIIGVPSGLGMISWWLAGRHPAGAIFDRYANMLSFAVLGVVGLLLVIDLGQPTRFFLMLTRFDSFTSPIALGAKIIAVKTGLLLVAIYAVERHRRLASTAAPTTAKLSVASPSRATDPNAGAISDASPDEGVGSGLDAPTQAGPDALTRIGSAAEPVVRVLLVASSFALAVYPAAVLSSPGRRRGHGWRI
jgi:hypothetical protein